MKKLMLIFAMFALILPSFAGGYDDEFGPYYKRIGNIDPVKGYDLLDTRDNSIHHVSINDFNFDNETMTGYLIDKATGVRTDVVGKYTKLYDGKVIFELFILPEMLPAVYYFGCTCLHCGPQYDFSAPWITGECSKKCMNCGGCLWVETCYLSPCTVTAGYCFIKRLD